MEPSASDCDSYGFEQEDCRKRYQTRALWARYLIEAFKEDSDYTDDPAYRWARYQAPGGLLKTDMCALARVLDDTSYAYLGGEDPLHPGEYRLRKVFQNYAIAKWLDSSNLDPAYSFGEDFSPVNSIGLFRKIESPADYVCYELAVPPQFVVGAESDSTWRHVPGNASESGTGCTDGWNDPVDTAFCENTYCDPVKVRLWGTDYIGLKADTTYYNAQKSLSYLRLKFEWDPAQAAGGTELRISVILYPSAKETLKLYRIGEEAGHIAHVSRDPTQASSVAFKIPSFHEGGWEAVAAVLTLTQTDYEDNEQPCLPSGGDSPAAPSGCMQRVQNSMRDLEYYYSFAVLEDEPMHGGGCPFVESFTHEGYESDNNVLVGGLATTDVADLYLLTKEPLNAGGEYRLQLAENDTELSHFDHVKLLAADRAPGAWVSLTDGGGFESYVVSARPSACTDDKGRDILPLLSADDGSTYLLEPGGWVDAVFRSSALRGGGAGGRGGPVQKIPPPGGRGGGEGPTGSVDLSALCYRANPSTVVVPIPEDSEVIDGNLRVRYTAPAPLLLDEVFLVEFTGELDVQECPLLSAAHSAEGLSTASLASDDGQRVDLWPGDSIDLRFGVPPLVDGHDRDFVLVADGNYETVESRDGAEDEPPPEARVSEAFPNPFISETAIRFMVPSPGGRVSVRVYDLAGRLVRNLGTEDLAPGEYEVKWDAKATGGTYAASGVYFLKIEGSGLGTQRKLLLLR